MIKQAIAGAGLAPFAVIGLVLFLGIFVGVSIWAFTRGSKQLVGWSSMPLADGHVIRNSPSALPQRDQLNETIELMVVNPKESDGKSSCGKCEDCTCEDVAESDQ